MNGIIDEELSVDLVYHMVSARNFIRLIVRHLIEYLNHIIRT
ncbi:hypothetical protein [Paenibacillus tundrae]